MKVTIELTYWPYRWKAIAYNGFNKGCSKDCITKWGAKRSAIRNLLKSILRHNCSYKITETIDI